MRITVRNSPGESTHISDVHDPRHPKHIPHLQLSSPGHGIVNIPEGHTIDSPEEEERIAEEMMDAEDEEEEPDVVGPRGAGAGVCRDVQDSEFENTTRCGCGCVSRCAG